MRAFSSDLNVLVFAVRTMRDGNRKNFETWPVCSIESRHPATFFLAKLRDFPGAFSKVMRCQNTGKAGGEPLHAAAHAFRRRQTRPCHLRRACFHRGVIFPLNSRLTPLSGN
jgi:hypothetical protein